MSKPDNTGQVIKTTAVIANAAALSGAVVIKHARIVSIEFPTITNAQISFEAQVDSGGAFVDLYDEDGVEVTLGSASTGLRLFSHIPELAGLYAFKIRSGLAGGDTNQGAERTMRITARD